MAKALLFIHSEKVPVRSQKYPHVSLSRSTAVFPNSAKEYLERLGDGRVVKADFEEKELNEANRRWLAGRQLLVALHGELYSTKFNNEIEILTDWAERGVSETDASEYNRRLEKLRKEAQNLRGRLFETSSAEKMVRMIGFLAEPNASERSFPEAHSNLKRVTSREQELFKTKVTELLIRPMEIGELAHELRMDKSNLRKRMRLLIKSGLVKLTTQRIPLGRPKAVYFLSKEI